MLSPQERHPCLSGKIMVLGLVAACLTGFVLILASPAAYADSQTVEVKGQAPIIAGDSIQARDEAIADARIRAVEEVVGVEIEASSVLSHELMVDSLTTTHTQGIIHAEEVLSEHEDEHGQYHVRLEVRVSPAEAQHRLKELLREDRIVILLQEDNLGEEDTVSPLRNKLTDELHSKGYQNIVSLSPQETSQDSKIAQGDLDQAIMEQLGMEYMADVVIVGELTSQPSSQLSQDYYCAHAKGWLRAYLVSQDKVLASEHLQAVRGYGSNMNQAGSTSLANAAKKLSSQVLQEIVPRSMRRLEVVYYGLQGFSEFKKQKRQLGLMRWVQNVQSERFHPEKTVFEVDFSESPEILASRLDQLPGLEVVGFESQKIEVEMN